MKRNQIVPNLFAVKAPLTLRIMMTAQGKGNCEGGETI